MASQEPMIDKVTKRWREIIHEELRENKYAVAIDKVQGLMIEISKHYRKIQDLWQEINLHYIDSELRDSHKLMKNLERKLTLDLFICMIGSAFSLISKESQIQLLENYKDFLKASKPGSFHENLFEGSEDWIEDWKKYWTR